MLFLKLKEDICSIINHTRYCKCLCLFSFLVVRSAVIQCFNFNKQFKANKLCVRPRFPSFFFFSSIQNFWWFFLVNGEGSDSDHTGSLCHAILKKKKKKRRDQIVYPLNTCRRFLILIREPVMYLMPLFTLSDTYESNWVRIANNFSH